MLQRLHCRFRRCKTGDEDDFRLRLQLATCLQHVHAVHAFHAQIGQHHVKMPRREKRDRSGPALGGGDLIAGLLHYMLEIV